MPTQGARRGNIALVADFVPPPRRWSRHVIVGAHVTTVCFLPEPSLTLLLSRPLDSANDPESGIDVNGYSMCWCSSNATLLPLCDIVPWTALDALPQGVTVGNLTMPAELKNNVTVYCAVRATNRAGSVNHAYSNGVTYST